jgi:uncharacterized protein YqjF (DUF2071 family)
VTELSRRARPALDRLRRLPLAADLDRAAAQGTAPRAAAHRPWRVPERPWFMGQTWERLLFAHWPVAPGDLERVVPPQLPLDVRDGQAWISVTPFEVKAFRLRYTLPVPLLSSFPEINVRTYVTVGGRPGIFFLSLDTSSRFAVESARRVFRLPYFRARQRFDGTTFESSRRTQADGPAAEFRGTYAPEGEPAPAAPGTLDWFLTERYCLYTLDGAGRVLRGEIHHRPWPLQPVELDVKLNTMAAQIAVELHGAPPLAHYAGRQDVVFWQLAAA